MIIDFHTHVFPDKIAGNTISALEEKGNTKAYSDGTRVGLENALLRAGVDLAVNLPVITKPSQFDGILRFCNEINALHGKVLSFAGAHPLMDDIKGKMRLIKESGVKGIKIHPDYQGAFFDDDGYIEILKCAKDEDLIVVTHSGPDCGFIGQPVKCTPKRILNALSKIGGYDKLVLAHMCSVEFYDEVLDLLAGKDLYFDTGFILKDYTEQAFKKFIDKHGDDKILFASDSPWSDIKADVQRLKSFNLGDKTLEKIFYKNALKLLGERTSND